MEGRVKVKYPTCKKRHMGHPPAKGLNQNWIRKSQEPHPSKRRRLRHPKSSRRIKPEPAATPKPFCRVKAAPPADGPVNYQNFARIIVLPAFWNLKGKLIHWCTIPAMSRSAIITTVIAVYGAVLSTIAIVRQLVSDRIKIKVSVSRNMKTVGDPQYQGMTLTILRVTNVGRRPVTITTFGAIGLYPNKSFVAFDSQPQLPCEITEGKYILSKLDQADIDFSTIDYWSAWDSRGRAHRLQEASWFKHWKSTFQLKRSFREKKAHSK